MPCKFSAKVSRDLDDLYRLPLGVILVIFSDFCGGSFCGDSSSCQRFMHRSELLGVTTPATDRSGVGGLPYLDRTGGSDATVALMKIQAAVLPCQSQLRNQ